MYSFSPTKEKGKFLSTQDTLIWNFLGMIGKRSYMQRDENLEEAPLGNDAIIDPNSLDLWVNSGTNQVNCFKEDEMIESISES